MGAIRIRYASTSAVNRRTVLAMDSAWYLPIALSILVLCCVLLGVFGADSRPGFAEGRTSVKDRWFVHSRDDYRR